MPSIAHPCPGTCPGEQRASSGLEGTSGFSRPSDPRAEETPVPGWRGRRPLLGGEGDDPSRAHWDKESAPWMVPSLPACGSGPGPAGQVQRFGNVSVHRPVHAPRAQTRPHACLSPCTRASEQAPANTCGVARPVAGPRARRWPGSLPRGAQGLSEVKPVGPAREGLPCSPSLFF